MGIDNQLISYPEREFISCRGHLQLFHGGFAETGGIRPTILWVYMYIYIYVSDHVMGKIGFSHHLSRFSSMGTYEDHGYMVVMWGSGYRGLETWVSILTSQKVLDFLEKVGCESWGFNDS